MTSLLGIDLGTSSVRALLVDADGTTLALNGLNYNPDIPRPGFAEQDPDFWTAMAFTTISCSLSDANANADDVRALSFSGQMHGLVCVDKDGKPLRPAIIWQDQRSKHVIREMYDRLGREFIGASVQNTVATGFLLASLVWLKENEPETYGKIHRVMLPKDYLKFRLSGVIATDFSDAAGTTALDNVKLEWSRPLLDALGLDPAMFPEILPSTAVLGTITPEAAAATGLSTKTLVVNGGADQCMQAVGNGIVEEGVFSSNIGTGGQMSACTASPLYDPEFRTSTFAHALPERWSIMGAALSAGASMKWLTERVLQLVSFKDVDTLAGAVPAGSGGLLFLPYLAGERTPHFDPEARGVFLGLTLGHDRRNLLRAVMEGVAFALRDSLDIILGMGVSCTRLIASGGGANSPLWLQIQADVFNQPIEKSLNKEQACLGAAITAGIGAGIYAGYKEAADQLVRFDERIYTPDPESVRLYNELHQMYKKTYTVNKTLFPALARVDETTAGSPL